MFQYALGRALAERHGTNLKLDTSLLAYSGSRFYALGPLSIQETFASRSEVRRLKFGRLFHLKKWYYKTLRKKYALPIAPSYIKEYTKFRYDEDVLNQPDNVYVEGSWQNARYSEDIAAILKKEFKVKTKPSQKNRELLSQICSLESVSLHVRRGDYVSNPEVNAMHGTCGLDYYAKSVQLIRDKVPNPVFFVFSDEPSWAKQNLQLGANSIVVDHNSPETCHEDLRLMSQCKHNVIANSSFSWWGAWLNENSQRVIVAPKKWFEKDVYDVSELIPRTWQEI
jgi:hypothetical protein